MFRVSLAFCIMLVGSLTIFSTQGQAEIGQVVLNWEPTAFNRRNSEGAFIALSNGRIMFAYSQFYSTANNDNSPCRIAAIYSDDQGKTWSYPPVIIVQDTAGMNVMEVSIIRLKSNKILLFYLYKNSDIDMHPYVISSVDEGQTWSDPLKVITEPGYFELANDRVIQTKSGRIIAPIAFYGAEVNDYSGILFWYYSDDDGLTWTKSESTWAWPENYVGFQEPVVVEGQERLYTWCRTDQGCQYLSISQDDGLTWSQPTESSLISPIAPANVKRKPNSNSFFAVYDDNNTPSSRVRNPFVCSISYDEGNSWICKRYLETDPNGFFCYPAIHFTSDSHVLLAYTAGDKITGGNYNLRIRRINLDNLVPGPTIPVPFLLLE